MTSETLRESVLATCHEQGLASDHVPTDTIRLSMLPTTVGVIPADAPDHFADVADVQIAGTIARGGMGLVQLAEQRSLARAVAVKTLLPDRRGEPWVSGLLREARITGQLEHPNIVPVHGLGWRDGQGPILVMKRIEGVAWSDLLAHRDHPLWKGADPDERFARHLEILMEVCQALEFAHSRGVIHRDVKPLNVMVGAYGEVVLLDWGVATDGTPDAGWRLVGTPAYLAPEMLTAGEPVTPRTDVYLLGACLHEVLTGRPRHGGRQVHDVLLQAALSEPALYARDVPEELGAIANRACALEPAARHPSALAFRAAIADFLRHRSSVATAEQAAAALRRLEQAVAGADPYEVHRHYSASRFGFDAALREWRDNGAAREGLQQCLETFVRYELERGNHHSAEPLIAELPEPRPALEAALAAVKARAKDRDRASAELAEMQRDLRVHGLTWARGQLALANGLITAGVFCWAGVWVLRNGAPTLRNVLMVLSVSGVVQITAILASRTAVLDTRAYRALMAALAAVCPLLMCIHLAGSLVGASWGQCLLADGFALVSLQLGIAAIDRSFWVSAGIAAVGTVIALALLPYAMFVGAVAYLVHTAWIVWALRPGRTAPIA